MSSSWLYITTPEILSGSSQERKKGHIVTNAYGDAQFARSAECILKDGNGQFAADAIPCVVARDCTLEGTPDTLGVSSTTGMAVETWSPHRMGGTI